MVCDDHFFGLGDCGNALGVIVIENFRLNIEYLRNSFYLKRSEQSGIYKYSICILQFSIPACPGWDLKGFNHEVKQVLCRSALNGLRAVDIDRENREPTIEGLKLKEGINREK